MPNFSRSLLLGGIEPLTIVGTAPFSLVPWPKASSPAPLSLSGLTITPLVLSASVPAPAPFAFVDQSMHGEDPSCVRFAPALKMGFLAVPPTIGASISKLLCPPETDVAFNVFGVAHVGANALGPDANATQLADAAAS